MLAPERRAQILDLVTRNKSVLVKDLCLLFDVTGETIRKDLTILAQEGRLLKTYGGAYIPDGVRNEIDASLRETVFTDIKDAIGRCCAQLVQEGDTVFLDESTTCLSIARYLASIPGVLVVTNSLKAAQVFADSRSSKLVLAGGELDPSKCAFVGEGARDALSRYHADLCFISCRGLDREAGLTDGGEASGALRRLMLQHSRRSYLAVDHTKLDRINFYHIGDFQQINGIIIDRLDDGTWRRFFRELGIAVTESGPKG